MSVVKSGLECLREPLFLQGNDIPSPCLTFDQTGFPEQFTKQVRSIGPSCLTHMDSGEMLDACV